MSRDYKKEYAEYHSKPEQKKNRAKRNKANRNSNCGPGQEVDHKVPLSSGGSNSPSNWRVVSKETNRKKGSKKMSSFDRLRLAIEEKTAAPDGVERLPSGGLKYRDETFPGYNKPKAAPKGSKHKKRVLAKKGDKVKVVNFGARGYKHNYSAKAKKSYLARSAGIKGKDDKFSANYWSRKELWPKNQKADGSAKKRSKSANWVMRGISHVQKTNPELAKNFMNLSQPMTPTLKNVGGTVLGVGIAGGVTGALGGRGAEAGGANALKGAAGGGTIGALGGLAISALSRGKINPGAAAARLGSLGLGVGAVNSYAQNVWGSDPRQRINYNSQYKTAAAEFDAATYYASLSPEQRQAMQDSVSAKMLPITKEYNSAMAPISEKIQDAIRPYQEELNSMQSEYNPRYQEALLAGYAEGGASEEYLKYLKQQQDNSFSHMFKGASADDNFDTSSVEDFMSSARR